MDRMISVYSNVLDGYNANEVVGEIENSLQDFDMPDGITYEFTGEQEQQAEDMEFLGNAFIIAVFLIFIILVTQFNSIISPFIIIDRKSTRLNSSHVAISYAVFCLIKKQ